MAFFNKILFYARTQKWIKIICIFLTGLTAALLAVWLFGATYINIEGITIKAAIAPARTGITEVHLPP
ncbi:MAG: hypothetical protein PHE26_11205, partial [Syntrophomonadaceae bacterium]|nr:hypothetical protein [Syntrophomonadaceae bacterium]